MKIGIGQIDSQFGNKKKNLESISHVVESRKADLWVFPELCVSGYMFSNKSELRDAAENMADSGSVSQLTEMAKKQKTLIIAGLPEIEHGKIYITAVAIGPEGLVAKNQKTHLFLKEKLFFEPGMTGPTLFGYQGAKIGLGICYDYMFPEYWRSLALRGADMFVNIANFVYQYGFYMMRARAIENGVYSICVNRVGIERSQKFFGSSEVDDNKGSIIYKAQNVPSTEVIHFDPAVSRNKNWNPYNNLFGDHRPEMY